MSFIDFDDMLIDFEYDVDDVDDRFPSCNSFAIFAFCLNSRGVLMIRIYPRLHQTPPRKLPPPRFAL